MPEYRHEEGNNRKALDSRLIKRMLFYLKPYKWRLTFGIAALLFWNAMYVVTPYLIKIAVDNYIAKYDFYG
ncbi:MAG: hypothetical protein R2883_07080 [Caldisericia bacterium]